MVKALFKKKLQEFWASKGHWFMCFLLAISLLPLIRIWFDSPEATGIPLVVLMFITWFMGGISAATAFHGDFSEQSNLFLEYLPVTRSAVWFTGYISGLAMLFLAAVSLLWLEIIIFPWQIEMATVQHGPISSSGASYIYYLFPSRLALVISCGCFLFWMFSVNVFHVAYLGRKDARPANPIGGMVALAGWFVLPMIVIATLKMLDIMPSGLALAPVLLVSGVLYSTGSYALFALPPKHITHTKRTWLGVGLFLMISAILVGQIYVKHFTWRILDPSIPLEIKHIHPSPLEGHPNLLLADVDSYRSGGHCVSIDIENATYHDLGRGLQFQKMPNNRNNLLYFWYSPNPDSVYPVSNFMSMSPDGTGARSFKMPGRFGYGDRDNSRWFPDKGTLVYSASFKISGQDSTRDCLCVEDSNGNLLKQYHIGYGYGDSFLVNDAGQALAIAPTANAVGPGMSAVNDEKPYMLIDLDSEEVRRFGVPGNALLFSKDIRRVIYLRTRIRNARRYKSLILVELSTMDERTILSENDLPSEEITSQQTDYDISPKIPTENDEYIVNNAFDAMLWTKQRVEGDRFHYSIILVDLNTGKQRVVVPESDLPTAPVVVSAGGSGAPIIKGFTADGRGFTYSMGLRIFICNIASRKSTLLADFSVKLDAAEKDRLMLSIGTSEYPFKYSPSGRRVLFFINTRKETSDNHQSLFTEIYVFRNGKPVQIHKGQRFIRGACWLDEERIIFHEDGAIFLLSAAGGSPRQIFPAVKAEARNDE